MQKLTLIMLVLSEKYTAAYVIMSATQFLAIIGLAAGVYDGDTSIIICSC